MADFDRHRCSVFFHFLYFAVCHFHKLPFYSASLISFVDNITHFDFFDDAGIKKVEGETLNSFALSVL